MEEFIKILEQKQEFIKNPMDFIYENIDEINDTIIRMALEKILEHNKKILNQIKKMNDEKTSLISKATNQSLNAKETPIVQTKVQERNIAERKNVSDKTETLFYTLDQNEFNSFVSNISDEEINYIKLELFKKIIEFKFKIRKQLLLNPISDIANLQEDLERAEFVLNSLHKKEVIEEKVEEQQNSKILILPNKKNNSYLYDDILEYMENSKEIKNCIDKMLDGYFLKTKDTRPIVGKDEKLYEYKLPSGLRIMYIVLPNNHIVITELFYKDKDKSTKIDLYYDEAINRYLIFKDYIDSNIGNPDFYIEQAELIGNIYDLLEKNMKREKGE